MTRYSRRRFLEESMFAAATLATIEFGHSALADEKPQSKSTNERLAVAIIGAGGRAAEHLAYYSSRHDTEVKIVCDVDQKVGQQKCEEVATRQRRKPTFVEDMRRVFDDPSIDLVTIATPNHWHALAGIWAMQAEKDVYVEKPVSHNVTEGRRLVEAAGKYKRICQSGTQSRSMRGMREAIAYLKSGKLGEVTLGRGLCYKQRKSIGSQSKYAPPPTVNYDLWSGPAPIKAVTRQRFHYDWHWFWDYGNGDLGNQGIHQMDIIRWGLGLDALCKSVFCFGGRFGYEDAGETANTQAAILDYGSKCLLFEVRGLPTKDLKGANVGVIFQGTKGYLVCPTYHSGTVFTPDGEQVQHFDGGGDHHGNFIDAVRTRRREDLNCDVLDGHLSSALCHLCNISYLQGEQVPLDHGQEIMRTLKFADLGKELLDRTIEHLSDNGVDVSRDSKSHVGKHLAFDPSGEQFVNNEAANSLLCRPYRDPFIVPAAGQV